MTAPTPTLANRPTIILADILPRYRANRALGIPAASAIQGARWHVKTAAKLKALDLHRWNGRPYSSRGLYGDMWTIPLAAEGWSVRAILVADDREYDPGDCHDPEQYPECRDASTCGCYPAEVYGAIAEVLDPARHEVASDSLWSIGSDGSDDQAFYVLSELLDVIENACHDAGVAANRANDTDDDR